MGGEQQAQMMTLHSIPSDKYDEQNKQAQREIHDALMLDLEDKERAIKQGMHVDQNHFLTYRIITSKKVNL